MVREFAPPAQLMFPGPRSNGGGVVTPFSSTFTPTIGLEVPARGDYPNQWDLPMDASLQTLDSMAGGVANVTVAGGNQEITLTQAQANCAILNVTGTLTGGWAVIAYPPSAGAGKKWVIPGCSGMSPTTNWLYVRGNNGADTHGVYFWTQFGIPHAILVTPSRVWWDYGGSYVGQIEMYASSFIPNGRIPLDGRLISSVAHDLLLALYGYSFGGSSASGQLGVPDFRGCALSGADNMGTPAGSAGRLNNYGIGGPVGEANHVLAIAEMPSHAHPGSSDSGHAHTASEGAHAHGSNLVRFIGAGGGLGIAAGVNISYGNTDNTAASVTVNPGNANIVVAAQGGSGGHNNIQPTRTCMACVRW